MSRRAFPRATVEVKASDIPRLVDCIKSSSNSTEDVWELLLELDLTNRRERINDFVKGRFGAEVLDADALDGLYEHCEKDWNTYFANHTHAADDDLRDFVMEYFGCGKNWTEWVVARGADHGVRLWGLKYEEGKSDAVATAATSSLAQAETKGV